MSKVGDFFGTVFDSVEGVISTIGLNAQTTALNNNAIATANQSGAQAAGDIIRADIEAQKRKDDLVRLALMLFGAIVIIIVIVFVVKKFKK